jgi:hypothetical protein
MARYQLRLNRRYGRTAEKVLPSTRFILIPLLNAYGSQTSEVTRCQKWLRVESRLTKRSSRSMMDSLWVGSAAGVASVAGGATTSARAEAVAASSALGGASRASMEGDGRVKRSPVRIARF